MVAFSKEQQMIRVLVMVKTMMISQHLWNNSYGDME